MATSMHSRRGEFADFGFGEAVAIRDDVAFIGVPRATTAMSLFSI